MLTRWTLVAGGTFVQLELGVNSWDVFETVLAILRVHLVGDATSASYGHTMAAKVGSAQATKEATTTLVLQ